MISKSQAKFIKSLQLKKQRKIEQLFVVEGEKSVLEVLKSSFRVKYLLGTAKFFEKHGEYNHLENYVVTSKILENIGSFKSNDQALAVVEIPESNFTIDKTSQFVLALDDINDPGNLGTIIRLADWYGIKQILASEDTADLYNSKVISATKGSFTRVNVHYCDLCVELPKLKRTIYAADMMGKNVHEIQFTKEGVLLMGNEANGISDQLKSLQITNITIPKFGGAESLNVAMATAIILDNIKRI